MKSILYFFHLLVVSYLSLGKKQNYVYKPAPDTSTNPSVVASQGALNECHLQVECTTSQQLSYPTGNANNSIGATKKIRIPVRAARGPQGPRGLQGPTGPRGPPGFSPEIDEDLVKNRRIRRRVTATQRLPSFTAQDQNSIIWRLEELNEYVDIHTLELHVGAHGFNDRLASLDNLAGSCSIQMVRTNTTGAHYCLTLESMLPEVVSTSVGIVIDWDLIEGTTKEEIWKAFQERLVDEKIYQPVFAAYSSEFRSEEVSPEWHRSLRDNTRRKNNGKHFTGAGTDLVLLTFLISMYNWVWK